jgi:hypothetical protein
MNRQQLEDHGLDSLETLSVVCGDFHVLAELLGQNNLSVSLKDLEQGKPVRRRGFFWRRLRPLICDGP